MKATRVLLFCFVLGCLLLAITHPLSAQQPKSPAPKPKVSVALSAQSILQAACRNYFFKSTDELRSKFHAAQDSELDATITLAKQCVLESTKPALRSVGFRAYEVLRDEQENRGLQHVIDIWTKTVDDQSKVMASMIERDAEQEQKLRADFAEAANFAAALFKQTQQYKQAYQDEMRSYDKLKELYRETYELAIEAVKVARAPSLPSFVNVPAPQVIRIETPPVPRSLHCTANTMPPPAPGLSTWTWTDCHW